ncbi:hypothetical protein HMPREF9444_00208 [Succinatimonas hippei YIT 12066]|uniref:Uncharacterized protein n=1 Tax=Succinatimonas hippei (strain DSM 22608 / JCM 16073 / KCTC 15190 / YIT 12066) TaxID=762983 RepID=E8LHM9_SUCHY|nr:hypothetical protein HMPREF9444_00208 [Succinatimonas hippei YIT 12066]
MSLTKAFLIKINPDAYKVFTAPHLMNALFRNSALTYVTY